MPVWQPRQEKTQEMCKCKLDLVKYLDSAWGDGSPHKSTCGQVWRPKFRSQYLHKSQMCCTLACRTSVKEAGTGPSGLPEARHFKFSDRAGLKEMRQRAREEEIGHGL